MQNGQHQRIAYEASDVDHPHGASIGGLGGFIMQCKQDNEKGFLGTIYLLNISLLDLYRKKCMSMLDSSLLLR